MKLCKLWIHNPESPESALQLNQKYFPDISKGNVVEIYHPDGDYSRLLLQVSEKSFTEGEQLQKDVISIAKPVAEHFHLRMYKDVNINIVDPKDVALDLVELTYKDQYFSRADMWRLRQSLVNTVMYLTKKIVFAEMRAQVNELWSKGERVACGAVTEDTRVTLRSSTAQVNIFIQMSAEMWEFDNYGDLYFEKAVGGFLVDLFSQWKDRNCNHDVTVTLFSRTFYEAKSIEEFPMHMRECVQKDHLGRFYEDFYRVVVQNERYEEWRPTLIQLKRLFIEYPKRVMSYHQRAGYDVPRGWNSTASQGNFLEVLNMALNVFEKYYLDRCFDRTGKLSIVITPGVGVFEVDRELTNVTKQRTIDCGNSSDLVCMGEQPLHAVPLFKFHNKTPSKRIDVGDDYNIPHWINYSFYTSKSQGERMKSSKFIPRVKLPIAVPISSKEEKMVYSGRNRSAVIPQESQSSYLRCDDDNFPFVDYDAYDAQVFKLPTNRSSLPENKSSVIMPKKSSHSYSSMQEHRQRRIPRVRYNSDMYDLVANRTDSHNSNVSSVSLGILIERPRTSSEEYMSNSFGGQSSKSDTTVDDLYPLRPIVGSANSATDPLDYVSPLARPRPHRALINPFAPARLHFKVTSNRRRWAHAFPIDPRGASMQPHHHASGPSLPPQDSSASKLCSTSSSPPIKDMLQAAQLAKEMRRQHRLTAKGSESSDGDGRHKSVTISSNDSGSMDSLKDQAAWSNMLYNHSSVSLPKVDSMSSISSVLHAMDTSSSRDSGRTIQGATGGTVSQVGSSGQAGLGSPTSSFHKELAQIGLAEEGHNWLWGITGEQEWTPETTTGMDWKSMTVPASLPITTDFFPDKRSLQHDYSIGDYTLLPEIFASDNERDESVIIVEVTSSDEEDVCQTPVRVNNTLNTNNLQAGSPDIMIIKEVKPPPRCPITFMELTEPRTNLQCGHVYSQRGLDQLYVRRKGKPIIVKSPSRKSLTTEGVFKEMICQRLAKGFQLVILPKKTSAADVTSLSASPYSSNSLVRGRNKQQSFMQGQEEHILSIGRIFHKLTLNSNTITVTRYWPRHPYPQKSIHYTYRFQVPDSDSYDVSWTNFSNEKLENYNWNKHDNFICSHGEDNNFSVMESLNHWRARFMLLPVNIAATKKIIDGSDRCDIYDDQSQNSKEYNNQLINGFLRFLEIMNNIKRPAQNRKTKMLTRRSSLSHNMQDKAGEAGKKLLKRSENMETPNASPYTTSFILPHEMKKAVAGVESGSLAKDGTTNESLAAEQLSSTTSMTAIIDAMLDPVDGLLFIPAQPGLAELPKDTFISAEASSWVVNHLQDISCTVDANQFLQNMIDEDYICHASGNKQHKFIYGFYLYYISVDRDKTGDSVAKLLPSNYYNKSFSFHNEWCEVAVHDTSDMMLDPSCIFHPILPCHLLHSASEFLAPELASSRPPPKPEHVQPASPFYKLVNVDSDPNQKSERPEWGSVRYHGNYSPDSVFELEAQWLVSTGCILGDLINTWTRKAGSCGFHFLPVPGDPFALPFNDNSDPLRGPIFIPLNVNALKDNDQPLFNEFDAHTRDERLLLLQGSILKRFGFMLDKPPNINYPEDMQPQYVHCSGGMFVFIPDNKTTSPRNLDGTHRKPAVGTYKHYIAWQRGRSDSCMCMKEMSDSYSNQDLRTGFLWAWNFMLNKRLRTIHTGDEHFQDKVLADFRAFCSNQDNRLRDFWEACRYKAIDSHTIISDEDSDSPLTMNFDK